MIEITFPRLRQGDVIVSGGRECLVVRVNDCSAVIRPTERSTRTITPLVGKPVTITSPAGLERISPNASVPILSRGPKPQLNLITD